MGTVLAEADETVNGANWRPVFDLAVEAYWRGDIETGRRACEWLLSLPDLPPAYAEQTRRNQVFYAPTLADLASGARTVDLAVPTQHGWSCFNPSIAATADGFRCIVRSSNYRLLPDGYEFLDPDGVVRTTNYLADLEPDFTVRAVEEIADRTDRSKLSDFPVEGFEDCRLFWWDGAWRATATARNRNPAGVCQQVLLTLADGAVVDVVELSDWRAGVHEKNWMPLVDGDDLRFVFACHPTTVLAFDPVRRTVATFAKHPAPPIARHLRGGGQVVRVDEGWLLLVHEGVDFENGGRVYPHRFVLLDDAFRLAALSPQFFFRQRQVEYAAGLALRDGVVVASVGQRDQTAFLATVPLEDVLTLLGPPLDPRQVDPDALVASFHDRAASPALWSASGATAGRGLDEARKSSNEIGVTPFPDAGAGGLLVSITIAGNAEHLIGDALRSVVEWVDLCLLIDTGITDGALAAARAAAGDKLVVRAFPWRDDFAAARNAALAFAEELGASWAVTIDTDERIERNGLDVRAALAATDADLLHVRQFDESYAKERFFRLPVAGAFYGPTHEAFVGAQQVEELSAIRFHEVAKSEDGYRRKFERDAAILAGHTAEHPDDPRWWYYFGDALQNLGRHAEAVAAYRACWALDGWDEESAWAMYRAAECQIALGDHRAAIACCADGLIRHPGIAELPWLAGFAAWSMGDYRKAVAWARMSAALGCFAGNGSETARIGFTNPRARYEGPFDVLRFALRALGDERGAAAAERDFSAALVRRESPAGTT